MPFDKVLKWTAENSKIPDFTFWEDRVHYGTLCAICISGYQQGISAGIQAKKILVDKIKPSEIPVELSQKGTPVINLTRAKNIGLKIDNELLLSAKILPEYQWNEK